MKDGSVVIGANLTTYLLMLTASLQPINFLQNSILSFMDLLFKVSSKLESFRADIVKPYEEIVFKS